MLISVVIPLYNKAAFITDAIRSVQEQTHEDWELVIVDDGSTDNGGEIVQALGEPRVRYVRQVNGGVSCARNRGIDLATGELVCFLDADDCYGPFYLEVLANLAHEHPETQYFAFGYHRLYPGQHANWGTRPARPVQSELIDRFFERRRRNGHIVHTNAVAVRRTALLQLQPCFPPGESHGEDQDLWFRLAERYPLRYCPLQLVAYRVEVAGSLMTHQAAFELVPGYRRLEQRALDGQIRGKERVSALRLIGDARVGIARNLLQAGMRGAALAELWRGRRAMSRHWMVTFAMALLFSPGMARRWRQWRRLQAPELRN